MPLSVQTLANRLTFRQLQVFLMVYDNKNYSRAGELLGLTQPAVSSQIRQLESALGVSLFIYTRRRLYATAAAEKLADSVQVIFTELRFLQTGVADLAGQVAGELKLAVVSSAQYILPHILSGFMAHHSEIDVSVRVFDQVEAMRRLQENQEQIFVMGMVPQSRYLVSLPFLDNDYVAVASTNHDVHSKLPITIDDFLSYRLLLRELGSGSRQLVEAFLQSHHKSMKDLMVLGSNEAIKHTAIAGLGVAVLPKLSIISEMRLGLLKVIEIEGMPLRRSWCLVYPKNKQPTPAMQVFLQYVQHNIQTIDVFFKGLISGK